MDYVLLFLAVVIWIHAETYDGSRPCKMDLDQSPHAISRADPRPDLCRKFEANRGTGSEMCEAQCADKAVERCGDVRAPK